MRHFLAPYLWILAILGASAVAIAQTEFSAEVVHHKGSGSVSDARLYFGKDKLRIESQNGSREDHGIGIMNMATHSFTVILPERHMYMELPSQMTGQRVLYDFFQTGNVESACADWAKVPHHEGGMCRKVGHETVNGRDTIKYEGTNNKGESGFFWIDPKLRFPVKWQDQKDPDDGGELRNIQEGPQAASLFEVPAGYQKFDMGSMMQRSPN